MTVSQVETHRQLIELEGTFDVPAAMQVAQVLEDAPAGLQVRIDLSRVREFHDFGIALLARALKGRPADVRGLRQHQVRLLRYLGIETEQDGEPVAAN